MSNVLTERIEHSFGEVRYSVSVEAVCWEEWKSDRASGLPTPWEIPTECIADLFADILYSEIGPESVYEVAEPMASEWVRRFGHVA